MNETETTKLFIDISRNLGEINSKMGSLCDVIAKHEQRITNLEQNKVSLKDTTIQWLVKGLISAIVIIGSMSGAGAILSKIFGAS